MAIKGKKLRDHYKNTDRDKLFNLNEGDQRDPWR